MTVACFIIMDGARKSLDVPLHASSSSGGDSSSSHPRDSHEDDGGHMAGELALVGEDRGGESPTPGNALCHPIPKYIKLNVGGTLFTTARTTLCSQGMYLHA